MLFFLMSQGSLDPKIRFLCQKVCSVARVQTNRQTDTKVNTEDTLSGFQDFSLQPIIKDRSNTYELVCIIHLIFTLHKKIWHGYINCVLIFLEVNRSKRFPIGNQLWSDQSVVRAKIEHRPNYWPWTLHGAGGSVDNVPAAEVHV